MQYVKVAAHGLIKKGDKYLVFKRSSGDDYMPGYWDIPGGTVKFQENIIDALNREIAEETGLTVKVGGILFCHDFPSGPERHQFQIVYECEYIDGEVRLNPDDHEEFKWVELSETEDLDRITFFDELCKYLDNGKN